MKDAAYLLGTLALSLLPAYHSIGVTEEEPLWTGESVAVPFVCYWSTLSEQITQAPCGGDGKCQETQGTSRIKLLQEKESS